MHHVTLGLEPGCGPQAVKDKWRELAAIHHPDRGGNTVEFTTVRDAYVAARLYEDKLAAVCPICKGEGKVAMGAGFNKLLMTCQDCKGTGQR